jgi:hypothetical protein
VCASEREREREQLQQQRGTGAPPWRTWSMYRSVVPQPYGHTVRRLRHSRDTCTGMARRSNLEPHMFAQNTTVRLHTSRWCASSRVLCMGRPHTHVAGLRAPRRGWGVEGAGWGVGTAERGRGRRVADMGVHLTRAASVTLVAQPHVNSYCGV